MVCYDFTCAAWGGRPFADGNEVINCINGNSRMVPIEVFEVRYPWMIEEYALQPDTAGPGRYRGAHALAKVLRAVDTDITVSSVSDRHKKRPWGLLGGGSGAVGGLFYQADGSDEWRPFTEAFGKTSPSKFANATIGPGDRVRLVAPGAGGYGDPADRDPRHDRRRPERRLDHARSRTARLQVRLSGEARSSIHVQSVATPALAHSSSSSPVPPPTPQAPMTAPSRRIGTAPRPRIMCPPSFATMPRKVGWSRPLGEVAAGAPEGGRCDGLALATVDRGPDGAVHALERDQPPAGITDGDAHQNIERARVFDRAGGDAVGLIERECHGLSPSSSSLCWRPYSAASGSGSVRSAAGP